MNQPYLQPETARSDSAPIAESCAEGSLKTSVGGLWRLRPDVVFRVEETGGLLFDPATDSTLVVNRTGAALLQWREHRFSPDEWRDVLSSRYPAVAREKIAEDVHRFLTLIASFLETVDDNY